ncbi:hypothetical protein H2O64_15140 [Kordia sp. YSTF-M3]|uniref:Uncharacterized protein n=1 Tax=Kordia aestuariivivens TaxID=2759037 RepID=A0ABR7QBR0_9FLAO|nr:hypothetical protein [Kordia aestuariivivens]MBC8756011.1 hypothetical protein [Kordia aestuariivivens]
MKKREFTSKLQFQKTTVVSFNKMLNVKGGTLQNVDTRVVSLDGYMCLTGACVTDSPTTAIDNTCPPPTTRTDTDTIYCGIDVTKIDCLETRKC